MTTARLCDFGASASAHSVFECPSVFTCVTPKSDVPSRDTAYELTLIRRIELLRAAEGAAWLEVERLTPPDDALNRIARRFVPPPEWFHEEDVL